MKHEDITEVSDPHQLTIDVPEHGAPEIRVLKGQPTDEELAAVVSVLATVCGAQPHPGLRNSTCGATQWTSCAIRSAAGNS